MTDAQELSKHVILKRKELDEVAAKLKSEFVGIDNVIVEIIDTISSWYIFPDLQTKPCLACAWGLTGVGKTALIRRLSELLNYSERHYEFDFGKGRSGSFEIENTMSSLFEVESGYPVIFSFDEFQLSRSIDEMGNEIDRSALRFVWEIIDTGKLITSRSYHSYSNLYSLRSLLQQLLREGVIVKKGLVIKGDKLYRYAMDRTRWQEDLRFIPRGSIDDLYEMLSDTKASELEIDHELLKLDGEQSIHYINEALKCARSPKILDLRKSLIFILGNLDEAYKMSNDFTGETDADQFHRMSLKIDLPKIKNALQNRFRSEQIARLGNNHVIYPAFSRISFEKIISLKISEYFEQLEDKFDLTFISQPSLIKMIYEEGVFPTQGVRPVLSCIDQNLKAKMGSIMSSYFLSGKKADTVYLSSESDQMIAVFKQKGKEVMRKSEIIYQKVQNLKKNSKDDAQALVGTHEAGHAVLSIVLLSVYPEEIFSQSMDSDKIGFTYSNFNLDYLPRRLMLNRVGCYFGGIVAEEIIFGLDNVTSGSSSDIQEATSFVAEMIRRSGMGETVANIQTKSYKTQWHLHDDDSNEEIREWLGEGRKLARKTLLEYKPLLIALSDYMSDNRTIKKKEIIGIVKKIYPELHNQIDEFDSYHFYRKALKKQCLNENLNYKLLPELSEIRMNKDK